MLIWSPRAALFRRTVSAVLSILSDSPVSELSLTLSEKFSRMSVGNHQVAGLRSRISSGTTSRGSGKARAVVDHRVRVGEDRKWPSD